MAHFKLTGIRLWDPDYVYTHSYRRLGCFLADMKVMRRISYRYHTTGKLTTLPLHTGHKGTRRARLIQTCTPSALRRSLNCGCFSHPRCAHGCPPEMKPSLPSSQTALDRPWRLVYKRTPLFFSCHPQGALILDLLHVYLWKRTFFVYMYLLHAMPIAIVYHVFAGVVQ